MHKNLITKTYYWLHVELFSGEPTVIFWLEKWVNGKRKAMAQMVDPPFWFLARQLLHTLPYPVFMHPMDRRYLYRYLIWKFPDPIGKFIASTFYLRKHW